METPYILLVEDEPAHAELVQRAFELRADPARLVCAGSLAEARDCLAATPPQLIIADWRLPDGESLELLHGAAAATIPMIIMTSYGSEHVAVEAMKAGVLDYIVKSEEVLLDMPHIAQRAIQQWQAQVERTRIQAALRQSEAQFRLLAENATDLIARLTTQGRYLYASPAACRLLGVEAETLVGRSLIEFVHPDDIGDVQRVRQRILQPPAVALTLVHRLRDANELYIWFESTAHVLFDEQTGAPLEIHVASRDITQRKLAEEELQRAHHALEQAYEATLDGWSRALELRDRETQGHTQRVTDMMLRLAHVMGLPPEKLIHVRRGVLLHDIGKLGVPDEILHKPGPLTEAEWVEMRRHPIYAFDMLYPITYLHPALDIPYCHHEWWDGSGYPRGLKGAEIPLEARLFAIVDVWDALSSDRPYRKACAPAEVRAHLQKQAGCQFEPCLVEVFLSLLDETPA
jgi:PAS domain S-box-containing protein